MRISKRTRKAVSPVIATLVLIVIAIVGAVGVGLILSSVSTSVSKQANAGNAGGQAQQTLLIGGSTTVFPVTESAKAAFEQQYHVNIVDAQGGSDAGMQGILSGSLDIGAASSVGAVTNLENAVVSNSITNVVPNPTLIGGSAVVVIENGPSGNGLLQDGSAVPNECQGITRAALDTIFEISGKFGIDAGACAAAGPTWNTLDEAVALPGPSATICAASAQVIALGPQATLSVPACTGAPADTGPIYSAYSRSDNSGTQDQFASFTGLPKQSASGNYPGFTAVGNPGVLAAVQGNSKSIGFVDLGFAEGLPAGSVCPSGTGGTTGNLCGVSMPMVMTKSPGAAPIKASAQSLTSGVAYTEGGAATTTYDGYVPISTSSANVHNAIIAALKSAYFVNPLTGQGSKAYFPDILASGTGLARTFYYVTNGTPTPIEQEWLSFITNFNQEYAFTNNGYFSQYDITSA